MYGLRNQNVPIGLFFSEKETTIVFCTRSMPKKRAKAYNTLCWVSKAVPFKL